MRGFCNSGIDFDRQSVIRCTVEKERLEPFLLSDAYVALLQNLAARPHGDAAAASVDRYKYHGTPHLFCKMAACEAGPKWLMKNRARRGGGG